MFKTTVKYKDYADIDQEEILRFNIDEDEMLDLIAEDVAFNPAFLSVVAADQDPQSMYRVIRKLILHSYGELSEDGKKFRKSPEIMNDFAHSAAYKALLHQFFGEDSDPKFTQEFILGIFPSKIVDELKKQGFDQKVVPMK
jgi:hypothetical protein